MTSTAADGGSRVGTRRHATQTSRRSWMASNGTGFVRRRSHPNDRRATVIELTDSAHGAVDRSMEHQAAIGHLFETLAPARPGDADPAHRGPGESDATRRRPRCPRSWGQVRPNRRGSGSELAAASPRRRWVGSADAEDELVQWAGQGRPASGADPAGNAGGGRSRAGRRAWWPRRPFRRPFRRPLASTYGVANHDLVVTAKGTTTGGATDGVLPHRTPEPGGPPAGGPSGRGSRCDCRAQPRMSK